MEHKDSGFTLVELIVATLVIAVLGISVMIIMVNMSDAFRKQNLQTRVMMETQTVNASLQESLKACMQFTSGDKYVEIELTNEDDHYWYYYLLGDDGNVYLKAFPDRQNVDEITYDLGDFLAHYIVAIRLNPQQFDCNADDITSYNISYSVEAVEDDVAYSLENVVYVRNGH